MPFPSCGCWEEPSLSGEIAAAGWGGEPSQVSWPPPLPISRIASHPAPPQAAPFCTPSLLRSVAANKNPELWVFFFKQNKKWLYLRQALGSRWFSPTAEAPPPFRAGCMWAAVLGSGAPGQGALRGAQASLLSGEPLQSRHPSSLLTFGLPPLGGGSL